MAYFAFVRHGLSQANIDGIVAGHFDTPLTGIGRDQARQTAGLLKDITFHHAFGSPLQRAKETLEIILSELKQEIAPTLHDEIKERNWGEIEGTPHPHFNKSASKYTDVEAKSWLTWDGRPPGGESYADMATRIVPFFDLHVLPLLKEGKNILMVSHNGVSKPLQRHLENLPHESVHTLNLKNCEVKLYQFDEEGKLQDVKSCIPEPTS